MLSINMKLIQGPFKRLDGRWEFEDSGDGGSTVSLVMEFEFKNKILQNLIGVFFNEVVQRMVGAFETRAKELYGESGLNQQSQT